MNYLIYIAVLPVVLLLAYIYYKDSHKEPIGILAKTFFFGVLIVIPAIIIELVLSKPFPTESYKSLYILFINVFVGIALIEESLKWLIIKLSIYRNDNFDETFDGIVYAVFASLGFACIENILYVFTSGLGVGILRAVTAVPLHACTGVMMGYYIGKAKLYKQSNNDRKKTNIFLSLLIPTTFHTLYDCLLITQKELLIVVWVLFTITFYIVCIVIVNKSTKENIETINRVSIVEDKHKNIDNKNNEQVQVIKGIYCTNCGFKIGNNNYCAKCGKKNELKHL